MNILMIILRIVHIFSGVLWVGAAFFNVMFVQPSVRASGADGQKVSQYMVQKTRLTSYVYGTATLNILAGLAMYYILSGFRLSFLRSGYGLVLTIGALAGLISWALVIFMVRDIFGRMGAIGKLIQSQGGPPTPEQASELQALGVRLTSLGNYGLFFMAIAVLGMSAARYVSF
ncbi:MAG: hypothetical protein JSV61_03175 [Anaerolineales bacterium]|nr:MAG: hypothetical protein JSV61_03175 [Anaerolineales bacterium]